MVDTNETKTAGAVTSTVGALSSVGTVLSTLKDLFTAFFFMMMEYARIKKKKAEDRAADLESQLQARDAKDEIKKANEGKSSEDIIDEFMSSNSSAPSSHPESK